MTPFELLVVVRIQLRDRALLRRTLALQAAMEALAPEAGLDVTLGSLAGLGAGIDAQLCRKNPGRRGEVAQELLLTEGAPPEVAEAARACWREPRAAALSPLAAALVGAVALVDAVYETVELGEALDDLEPARVARRVTRRAERRADAGAKRALDALSALGVEPARAAALVVQGMRDARADLDL